MDASFHGGSNDTIVGRARLRRPEISPFLCPSTFSYWQWESLALYKSFNTLWFVIYIRKAEMHIYSNYLRCWLSSVLVGRHICTYTTLPLKKYKKVVTYILILMSKCYHLFLRDYKYLQRKNNSSSMYVRWFTQSFVWIWITIYHALTFQVVHSRIILKLKICAWFSC
jgi:hypothetical protein